MENFSDAKAIQVKAVEFWINIVRVAAKAPAEPDDEIDEVTVKARHRFCETIATTLKDLIRDQQGDQNGLIYGLVVLGQIYGIYVGTLGATKEAGFDQSLLIERERPVTVGAVH